MASKLKTFGNLCARLGAAIVTVPLIAAGLAVAIAGRVATIGTWVPGLIASLGTYIATKNSDKANIAFQSVTYGVAALGLAMLLAGVTAGQYAVHGKDKFQNMQGRQQSMFRPRP